MESEQGKGCRRARSAAAPPARSPPREVFSATARRGRHAPSLDRLRARSPVPSGAFVPSGVRYRGLQMAEAAPEQEVEDFSPKWWRLVSASLAFRDRWLCEYGVLSPLDAEEEDLDDDDAEVDGFLPDDFFSPPARAESEQELAAAGAGKRAGGGLEVAAWGIDKWWRAYSGRPEAPRYAKKAQRRVAAGARVSPHPIQQPRRPPASRRGGTWRVGRRGRAVGRKRIEEREERL